MSFRALRRAIIEANGQPVAMEARRLEALAAAGVQLARGGKVRDAELAMLAGDDGATGIAKRAAALARPTFFDLGGGKTLGLISFRGLVNYELEFQPFAVSTKLFVRTVGELARMPEVAAIGIVVNSPGGLVTGTPEAADALFAARKLKRVTAIVEPLAASAAYWVASQASAIVAMPTADVGSIGVRMMHVDCSGLLANDGIRVTHIFSGEFKTEGNMFEPLGDVARARFQAESDAIYADFLAAVARGRGVSTARVRETFGKGRLVPARDALGLGMIDRIELADAALARLVGGNTTRGRVEALEEARRYVAAMEATPASRPCSPAEDLARRRRELDEAEARYREREEQRRAAGLP